MVEAGWTPEQDEAPPFRLLGENGVQNVDPATLSVFMHVSSPQCSCAYVMSHTHTPLVSMHVGSVPGSPTVNRLRTQSCPGTDQSPALPRSRHGAQLKPLLLCCVAQQVGCMQMALGRLMGHEEAWPFVEPVSATDVPDYYTIIKARPCVSLTPVHSTSRSESHASRAFAAALSELPCVVLAHTSKAASFSKQPRLQKPHHNQREAYITAAQDPINFSTIRQRLEAGNFYRSLALFTADVRHLCQNARVYNSADTFYYKSADKLESLYDSLLNSHLVFDSSVA